MIKYNKKWCQENCPYLHGDKIKWDFTVKIDNNLKPNINFKVKSDGSCYCIELKKTAMECCGGLRNKKNIEKFIKENIDMEKDAVNCPLYADLLIQNWNETKKEE